MQQNDIVSEILSKIPRPNFNELPKLYIELDEMTRRIARVLMNSQFYDSTNNIVYFDKMSEHDILKLIAKDPDVMVPFFVMICGLSTRELERFGVKNVYSLRNRFSVGGEKERNFAKIVKHLLKRPLHLETVLFKFYKNWEEHQKRHYRSSVEEQVREFIRSKGYECDKMKIECEGEEIEFDVVVPPKHPQVIIQVRTGVMRDLKKRAKEFSSEFDAALRCTSKDIKFVVAYFVQPHELEYKDRIRKALEAEREGKRPYDYIVLEFKDLETLVEEKFKEWNVRRKSVRTIIEYLEKNR